MYIAVYVNNLLLIRLDIINIKTIKAQLSGRFSMTDLGPITYYLGIKVTRD
jgi:hypothetical protein